jgi:hypothetical protein
MKAKATKAGKAAAPGGYAADRQGPARAVPHDGPHPRVRGGGPEELPRGPGPRHNPSLPGAGSGLRRHRLRVPRGRLHRLHLSWPRPLPRPRHGRGGRLRRAFRPHHRGLRRRRRVHAPHRHQQGADRRLRHRRRRPPGVGRRRRDGPDERPRPALGDLLRRRRDQHRRLPRGDEHRPGVEAAGPVHLREQPLRRVHPHQPQHALRGPDPARRRLRHGERAGRRQRRRGGLCRHRRGREPRPLGWRTDLHRVHDLPPPRPFTHRPGQVPRSQGGRGLARPRPAPALRGGADQAEGADQGQGGGN